MLEHHVGAVIEHEADEAKRGFRAVILLPVSAGRERFRQQVFDDRFVVVNAEQMSLDLLQRCPVCPFDTALAQTMLSHQEAAAAFLIYRLLVELPHSGGTVEAEIYGARNAATR